jgi:hypothetical protein
MRVYVIHAFIAHDGRVATLLLDRLEGMEEFDAGLRA